MRLALVAILGLGLAGCVSNGEAPEWFAAETAASDESYPDLREVPTGTSANMDAEHWAEVEAEVLAAAQDMRSNPRSQPAGATESPAEFLDEARDDLEETRQSHEPN